MNDIIDLEHRKLAGKVKNILSVYKEAEDLINIGAYVKGSNPQIDESIKYINRIEKFLKQDMGEKMEYIQTLDALKRVFEDEEL